jgi:hypothetical protein
MRSFGFVTASFAALAAAIFAFGASADTGGPAWGPETPNFNLEVILRSADGGSAFGLVKFRQPNDNQKIVYLTIRVRDLAPNHSYYLQRATDSTVNDVCTGTNWLTLGQGPVPQAITTNETGTAQADLFRNFAAVPTGSQFDIYFRLIDAVTSAVVLQSGCYQFTVDGD